MEFRLNSALGCRMFHFGRFVSRLHSTPTRRSFLTAAGALPFAQLTAAAETAAVQRAYEAVRPDDHAKYLLTSGSTGSPKVVINTHRMLCANQQMIAQTLRFLSLEKPVLLDWLPWSHTFGGNHNFNMVLSQHAGT